MNKVLLLSIRPAFSAKIFSGEKRVELRRLRPSVRAGDLVLVYTSSPSCELTGAFEVKAVKASTPEKLWAEVRTTCGISREQYDYYYQGSQKAYGIVVKRAWRLDVPLKLASMRKRHAHFHPPQSYRYFAPSDLAMLMPTLTARDLLSSHSAGLKKVPRRSQKAKKDRRATCVPLTAASMRDEDDQN